MKQILSEEFRRMQKLASIITESQLNENVDLLQFIRENQKEIAQKLNANRLVGIQMGGGEVRANIITNSEYLPGRELRGDIAFSTEPLNSNNEDHTLGQIEIKGRIIYYDIDNSLSNSGYSLLPSRGNKLDQLVGKAYDKSSLFRKVADRFIKPDLSVSSNNRFKLKEMSEAKEDLFNKYKSKIETLRDEFIADLKSNLKDLKKLPKEDKTKLSQMIRNLTGAVDDALSENKKIEDTK